MQDNRQHASIEERERKPPQDAKVHANKHQAKTEQTRRKLLKSARKIFARDGFEAARLEDIARDAGHTRGAFYAHFSRKEDLFFALLKEQWFEHVASVQELVDGQSETGNKLRVMRDFYVRQLANSEWALLMLEFKLFAARHKRVRKRLAAEHREIRQSLNVRHLDMAVKRQRMNPDFSPNAIRVILDSLLQAIVLQREFDPTLLSEEEGSLALKRVFELLIDTA
jgi:AcrR family transcriptional regulator